MIKDYISLSLKSIRKRGIRSWLTMLGIFIGIAAVVSLISLGQGLEQAVVGQFGSLGTDVLTVTNAETGFGPPGSTAVKKLTKHDLELIESVQGVDLALPRLLRVVEIEYNDKSSFKYVVSIPPTKEGAEIFYDILALDLEEGDPVYPGDDGKVVLGNDFIKNNEYGKDIRLGSKLTIQGEEFRVGGVLERASSFIFNGMVIMTEDDVKDILDIGDEIDLIAVKVQDPDELELVAGRIEEKLRNDRHLKAGDEDFAVETPQQTLSAVGTILSIINIVVGGIAGISLLIGGVGIANTMFTSVLERTKEIGIMKAVGAKNKDIIYLFITESALLGLAGGLIGMIIGLGLAYGASAVANSALGGAINMQVVVSVPFLVGVILFSLIIGVVSGVIPAMQASKLHPVEALRE